MRRCWLLPIVAVAMTACNGGGACTAIFAMVTTAVVDTTGQPVSGLVVTDTVLRTGDVFAIPQNAGFPSGSAVIFSDLFLDTVRPSGDLVRVTGTIGGRGFSASYTFGTDGCHVRKLAGPDTVVVR